MRWKNEILGIVVVCALLILNGSFYSVGYNYCAVTLRLGKVTGVVGPNRWCFKLPLIDDYVPISTQIRTRMFKVQAVSRDHQTAVLLVSVSFRVPLNQADSLYTRYGSLKALEDRLITRSVDRQSKATFAKLNASYAVLNQADLARKMAQSIKTSMSGQPIQIVNIQLEGIGYSSPDMEIAKAG